MRYVSQKIFRKVNAYFGHENPLERRLGSAMVRM